MCVSEMSVFLIVKISYEISNPSSRLLTNITSAIWMSFVDLNYNNHDDRNAFVLRGTLEDWIIVILNKQQAVKMKDLKGLS